MRPRGYPDAAYKAINLTVPDAATILQQPGQIGGVWSAFPAGGTAEFLFGPSMPSIGAKARVIPPLTAGSLPVLLCVTKRHHYRARRVACVARPSRATATEHISEISLLT
jgi:hypothetical protein